ncbi:MAG TPA: nucleoside-diphosphate sugar epimerase/dehydratase, partial [Gemmatimonadales bacterium]|nr:nucleoside-diphosphate sugar epimerase/dehydratase [Gemmatimonadales bacterium]
FAVRFDFRVPSLEVARFWATLPYVFALRVGVFQLFGLYRGYWKHVSLRDLLDLLGAVSLSSALFVTGLLLTGGLRGMPRSVLLLDWILTIFVAGGIRFAARVLLEAQLARSRARGKRTFIIGAGEAAEQLVRQVLHDSRGPMDVVGLIDDNRDTHGRTLHGVRVLGGTDRLTALAARYDVGLLVIAMPSATAEQTRQVVERCRETQIEYKIIPSLPELLSGREIGQLRDVQIEDLLGREPVHLNLMDVQRDLAGKSILVTGGAGSIGAELCRQIASYHPARLVILDRAESPLYFIHLEVSQAHPDVEVIPFMGSITNPERLDQVFRLHSPDYVFHAAAYKHVPLLEANAVEAVWNNVFGTLRVAMCAALHGVRKFVLISTDKAVNPSSMLGATKRIAERIALELPVLVDADTDFRAVRFGNVLGSDGSVVPLFKRQIAAGGPVQVTHRDVTRYFMTIPEAVQLVLAAAALPEAARRVSILEMGRPVRILDLAEQLIRLSGFTPHQDIKIEFTGLRPGEKLDEELVGGTEDTVSTSVDKIRVVERNGANGPEVERGLEQLLHVLARGDHADMMRAVSTLVPEYGPWAGHAAKPVIPFPAPLRPGPAIRIVEPATA